MDLCVSRQNLSDIERDRRGVGVERAAAWAGWLGYRAGPFVLLALEGQVRAAKLPFVVRVEPERLEGPKSRAA